MPTPSTALGAVQTARGASVRLLGVVHAGSINDVVRLVGAGAQGITFNEVAAVVRPCVVRNEPLSESALLEHHAVIAGLSRSCTIVPAPPLTTFKTGASVMQWLELHAVALADGLAYVDNRYGARVTAERDVAGATSDPSVLP